MDQHPIPRNVTGFQFQLIGFMTLKQFFYLLFGAGFGLVFWKSPLGILSIPLALFSALVGVAFAFLPIQDRPLEVWIKNFLLSIYSPTQFVWLQEGGLPPYLEPEKHHLAKQNKKIHVDESIRQDTRNKLQAYLQTVQEKNSTAIDKQEQQVLDQVSGILKNPGQITPVSDQTVKISKKPQAQKNTGPIGIIGGTVRAGNKPLSGILLTIFDVHNQPVRMVTSDHQGHFRTKLPLNPGLYRLVTEDSHNAYQFKQYSFKVDQTPLKPWLISPISSIS